MILKIIFLALLLVVGLLCYIAYKVTVACRFLTAERLQCYLTVLEYFHDCSHQMKTGGRIMSTKTDESLQFAADTKKLLLIGSFATGDAFDNVMDAMMSWRKKIKNGAPDIEISSSQVEMDRALDEIWRTMRMDLKLINGDGRLPSLGAFRSRQAKRV